MPDTRKYARLRSDYSALAVDAVTMGGKVMTSYTTYESSLMELGIQLMYSKVRKSSSWRVGGGVV